ncbi:MAG: aspartate aminotransferase family protein [Planctomycetes bacterium]|nr:aspartate aminotransferase family protein [Planctomycetota bacterium]
MPLPPDIYVSSALSERTMVSPLLASYPPLPINVDRAEGCEIIDKNGKRYIDLYGGHCVCSMGHNPKGLAATIAKQMERITFYSAALELPERFAAARALISLCPPGLDQVFLSNSGAEANENALKIACNLTERTCVVAIEGAFHGRTAAVDCLCGDAKRKHHFPRTPFDVRWVPFGDAAAMHNALAVGDVAAVILEPIQSMAGCRVHPPEVISAINETAGESGTIVIADEVQGGVGRTNRNWSFEVLGLQPDIVTCAKGIGAGFPTAATIVRSDLGDVASSLLGSTFGGGPLACRAITWVVTQLAKPELRASIRHCSTVFDQIADIEGVVKLHGIGLLRGIEIAKDTRKIRQQLLQEGFIVGGSSNPNVMRLMPPLTLPATMAERFNETLAELLSQEV